MIDVTELNNIFVTADHHFGHENIIRFCERPFKSVEEMDRTLIDNWNEVIKPGNTVYHLGDFTLGGFSEARKYFRQLNGDIRVLANRWHHDKRWLPVQLPDSEMFRILSMSDSASTEYHAPITILPPLVILEVDIKDTHPLAITLCHYPLAVWDRQHYGAWALGGYTHAPYETSEFILNIGVDCTNYYPISLGDVVTLMYEKGWG